MQLNKGYIDYVYCTYASGYQYGAPNRRRQAGANAGEGTDRWIDEQQGEINRPVRSNRRSPVAVYRTGLTGQIQNQIQNRMFNRFRPAYRPV